MPDNNTDLKVYLCPNCGAKGYESEVLDEVAFEMGHQVCWECGCSDIVEVDE